MGFTLKRVVRMIFLLIRDLDYWRVNRRLKYTPESAHLIRPPIQVPRVLWNLFYQFRLQGNPGMDHSTDGVTKQAASKFKLAYGCSVMYFP